MPRARARSVPRRDRAPRRLEALRQVDRRQGFDEPARDDQVRVQTDPAGRPNVAVERRGQGLVLGGEDAEVLDLALCPLEDLVRGEVCALVGEHAGEHLARALR